MSAGNLLLASGAVANRSQGSFEVRDISVVKGDVLYFIVDPNANYEADTTAFELTITDKGRGHGHDDKPDDGRDDGQ